ncbi:4Fe-4S dicluster domain-containing protein [Chloroflexota bacterium]
MTEEEKKKESGEISRREFTVTVSKFVCPIDEKEFDTLTALQAHFEAEHPMKAVEQVYGREVYPLPGARVPAFIYMDEASCTGCALCTYACSMKHFGVINKDASNIQVQQPQIPIIKGIPVTCSQCQVDERECEKACPTTPQSITYDTKTMHMVINKETCLGQKCLQCQEACNAKAVRFNAAVSDMPFVCDLCDTENTGNRDPECVKICPFSALSFRDAGAHHWHRRSIMEKADMLAQRIYPITKESFCFPDRNW